MRIGMIGCAGRMGRTILKEILQSDGALLAGGVERAGSTALGQDLGVLAGQDPVGILAHDDVQRLIDEADAVIEFSSPEASLAHARLCAGAGTAHVIGTTGFDGDQIEALRAQARRIPIVWAPNMSQGVSLVAALVERVAKALDDSYDIEIVEMHHRHKVDAPSGTALALGRSAAAGRGIVLDEAAVRVRDGQTGPRPRGSIGFATLRGGDVVGDHTVIFAGDGERIEITHKASDRRIYAKGAVRAALWTAGRPPGLYGMADVIGMAPKV
ncbi:4-hydroxy-tetrahydrodipicolinate reductase [Geminicoccaceae bacterium 1502E]|nr:4-hydroxy-tetrahydrodipicolinate reductase [Geminicoccaceae bacterium 1502E]